MLELKELLGQWKDLPQLMGMEESLAPTLDKNGNCQSTERFSHRTRTLTSILSGAPAEQTQLSTRPAADLQISAHQSLVDGRGFPEVSTPGPRATSRFRNAHLRRAECSNLQSQAEC